ncbi:terpenoid synthase [Aspergillus japonicus CBS 114.51]|uniref:Terpenoid synthase n=2 Tax=Aspergillus TaxID=5052 RepID=A0A2V5IF71_ASPV1|nr:terpenoid synthase [Aspergillus japonicus CBS 114.51]PYI22627.1 terpenoid synthase [Aspergillus violaceofuscus CBS 115571]RAH77598.1 terpenoid synthase [Aspergillus japonicus CBS 114.51]
MLSTAEESTFGYHGLDINGPPEVDIVKGLIKDFLEAARFDRNTPSSKDTELEAAVWKYFKSLNLGQKLEAAVQKVLKLSTTLTHQAYTSLAFENQVLCAVQFLYMFLVDDAAPLFLNELRCFCQNFTLNNDHHHPLLRHFDAHLRYLARYYGPYCHSTIVKSLFDYVNGRIIEHDMEQANFQFSPTTRLMPMFLRTKVGAAEILVSLLWPQQQYPEEAYLIRYFPAVQELVLFTDFTNDILSYYKEFVVHQEKGNFVANFAEAHGMSHLEVLRRLVDYAPRVIGNVYEIFAGKEELVQPVRDYVNGWIMLCTAQRRYHLVELFGDEGFLPPYADES